MNDIIFILFFISFIAFFIYAIKTLYRYIKKDDYKTHKKRMLFSGLIFIICFFSIGNTSNTLKNKNSNDNKPVAKDDELNSKKEVKTTSKSLSKREKKKIDKQKEKEEREKKLEKERQEKEKIEKNTIGVSKSKYYDTNKIDELGYFGKNSKYKLYSLHSSKDILSYMLSIDEFINNKQYVLINTSDYTLYKVISDIDDINIKVYDYIKYEEFDENDKPRTPILGSYLIDKDTKVIVKQEFVSKENNKLIPDISGRAYSRGKDSVDYIDRIGYLAIERFSIDKEFNVPRTIPTYRKIDADHLEEDELVLPDRVKVKVMNQAISHRSHGWYEGALLVKILDGEFSDKEFIVDATYFVPYDYWNDHNLAISLRYGELDALYKQKSDYLPVDSSNNIIELKNGQNIIISHKSMYENDKARPIEAYYFNAQGNSYYQIYLNEKDIELIK